MKVIFKKENGTTIEFSEVENFDDFVELAESHKSYGIFLYADDLHNDEEVKEWNFDIADIAQSCNWSDD